MRIDGRTWVVTGAGSGLGREVVLQSLGRGGRVAAVDMRAQPLSETAQLAAAGPRLSTHVVDITDRAQVEALVGDVERAHGAVDGVINNAGIIQQFVPVADLDEENIEKVLDVNLMGTIHMIKGFLPVLLTRPEAHLVNVSSMGGVFPFPGQSVYGASKAAVKLLTEGLYAELLDGPVRVSCAIPGAMNTNIAQNSGVTTSAEGGSGMPMTPVPRAARILLDGVERDRLHIYVGRDARLSSLAIRIAPRPAIRLVQRLMRTMMTGVEMQSAR